MDQDRKHFERRRGALDQEFSGWRDHLRELSDYISPRTSRFLATDRATAGSKKNSKILDNTATMAAGTLSSGLMSGGTSPARPWFQLRTSDPALNERHDVKAWLEHARKRMIEVFIRSNLYTVLPNAYNDLAVYGTTAFTVVEDAETVIRCHHAPMGSYLLGVGERGIVDSYYRDTQMTVSQVVERFGIKNCSPRVQGAFKQGSFDLLIDTVHAVEPNWDVAPNKLDSRFKRWVSVYYEKSSTDVEYLSRKGFDEFPVMAPRWDVIGDDPYGVSPGMVTLGDVKQLQTMQNRKLELLSKSLRPPLDVPVELKRSKVSLLPGDLTFTTRSSHGAQVVPIFQPQLNLQHLSMEIQETQRRIKRGFYEDLFLMFASIERSGITATEIAARQEEKLLALGPVYLRLNDELLDRLIERVFNIMQRQQLFMPPPPDLENQAINVEYISVMAQTMKSIGIASIERTISFAGSMAQAFPTVLDNIDPDATIREYADMAGTSPSMLFDPKVRDAARQARERKAAMAEGLAAAQQGADVAQKLSNSQLGDNNALAQLMQRMGQGQPQQGAPA